MSLTNLLLQFVSEIRMNSFLTAIQLEFIQQILRHTLSDLRQLYIVSHL